MSAHFAKDQVSFVSPASLSNSAPSAFVPSSEGGIANALRSAANWLTGGLKRHAVINELSALSDHELADIGLSRADIPNVFDSKFAAARSCLRG
jgi:uncharacterized protein YjiS (DUF1127 family)